MMEEENVRNSLDQFRAWHDEAYLYINQAITQEKPSIDRKDVALMMYQKGLGLIDLALCFDTEVKYRTVQFVNVHVSTVRARSGMGQSSKSPAENVQD